MAQGLIRTPPSEGTGAPPCVCNPKVTLSLSIHDSGVMGDCQLEGGMTGEWKARMKLGKGDRTSAKVFVDGYVLALINSEQCSTDKVHVRLLTAAPLTVEMIDGGGRAAQKSFSYLLVALTWKLILPGAEGAVNREQLQGLFYWATSLKIQEQVHSTMQIELKYYSKFSCHKENNKYREHWLLIGTGPWHMHIYQILKDLTQNGAQLYQGAVGLHVHPCRECCFGGVGTSTRWRSLTRRGTEKAA